MLLRKQSMYILLPTIHAVTFDAGRRVRWGWGVNEASYYFTNMLAIQREKRKKIFSFLSELTLDI